MTHKDVEQLLLEEIIRAERAGIPISKDISKEIEFPKATSFYGMCCPKNSKHPDHEFYIRISEYFLSADKEEIRQTMMHELIHTCKNCLNHGSEWRKWVQVANQTYGYQISRIGEFHKETLKKRAGVRAVAERRKTVYRISCPECGRHWDRTRRSNATENIKDYCCPQCKHYGKLTVTRL